MPMGDAYFLDLNTFQVYPVQEHYTAVKKDPRRYRMQASEITPNRDETLLKVLKRGFVRIREDVRRSEWSMEGYGSWDDMYAAAISFANIRDLPMHAHFRLGNLRDRDKMPESISLRELLAREGFTERGGLYQALAKINERRDANRRKILAEALKKIKGERLDEAVDHVVE